VVSANDRVRRAFRLRTGGTKLPYSAQTSPLEKGAPPPGRGCWAGDEQMNYAMRRFRRRTARPARPAPSSASEAGSGTAVGLGSVAVVVKWPVSDEELKM
jgi:hypothetical protein